MPRRSIFAVVLLMGALSLSVFSRAESIATITSGMERQQGLFDYFWDPQQGRLLLQVDTFDRELLLLTGLAQGLGSNPVGLDRNQVGDSRVVKFERVGNKVLLHQVNLKYRALSDNPAERRAVSEAFASSVIWGFKVLGEEAGAVLVDFTPFVLSDQHGIAARLKQAGQGSYSLDKDRSAIYLPRTKSFPKNSEFEAQLTFAGSDPGKYMQEVVPTPQLATLRQHISLVALPDDGYQPRRFHSNSGYFPLIFRDYATAIDQPMDQRLIFRHRLEKRPGSNEPVEPIVYYIDPGVPEPVRSALIDGASWWNEAFEAAGFENAFQVKLLPEDADPLDVRYNVINWVHRSTRGWSYGYSIYDPRTGEILKGNVTLGSLRVRQDFLIAQGLLQPYGNKDADTEQLKAMALARIRQLSAHEVGHTIGLAHNFISSAEDRASVMDYPAPLVTLAGSKLDVENAYASGIGAWDKLAIRYGYGVAEGDEAEYLAGVLEEAQQQKLRFITDRDSRSINNAHAYSHLWDNGREPLDEFQRMTELRKHALENFGPAANTADSARSSLDETLVPVYYGHRYQAEAVGKLIGGLDYDYLSNDVGDASYQLVSADQQQQAIDALAQTLRPEFLTLPEHVLKLLPPKAFGYSRSNESFPAYTGVAFDGIAMAEAAAGHTFSILLDPQRAARLQEQQARRGDGPGFNTLLAQLTEQSLASEQYSGLQAAIHQRVNHVYIHHLMLLAGNKQAPESARARANFELAKFQHAIGAMKLFGEDPHGYNAHYFYEANRIAAFMDGDLKVEKGDLKPMPPGSPI
ncbi:zinc-dependent metalloprotease [Microbulbifer agarilyticus]|uniref:zinc-dependent metalloprotease n=1 Tax=Microbulbifer agarilyticus TaxID=260552 RepID=UPI001C93B4DE|nr:zinc-dependent metalloprotease [Microbulbifer agarilyticus]MBY6211844.1 zinc-dependent metalloprotease [Microbulbifer agarilyticus]